MLSPQNIEALKAFHLKLEEERAKPKFKKKYLFVDGGEVIHQAGTAKVKHIRIKRALLLDRSIYKGDILRQWRSINGCGKGLTKLIEQKNKRPIVPNETTIAAMQDARNGVGMKRSDTVTDLMKELHEDGGSA